MLAISFSVFSMNQSDTRITVKTGFLQASSISRIIGARSSLSARMWASCCASLGMTSREQDRRPAHVRLFDRGVLQRALTMDTHAD